MRGYRIKENGNLFYFELIPSNNNNRPIGISKGYYSEKECINAIREFSGIIKDKNINSLLSEYVYYEKSPSSRCFKIKFNDDVIYTSRLYTSNFKANCNRSIKDIYNHIDKYTTNDKGE